MQVLSVDFGGKEWVDVSSLRRLPDAVADLSPFAVCCRLANIEPLATADTTDPTQWLNSATECLLADAAGGKLFTAWLEDSLPAGAIVRYILSDVLFQYLSICSNASHQP